eukprot:4876382-Pleurochrysis_carterae.AAC.1
MEEEGAGERGRGEEREREGEKRRRTKGEGYILRARARAKPKQAEGAERRGEGREKRKREREGEKLRRTMTRFAFGKPSADGSLCILLFNSYVDTSSQIDVGLQCKDYDSQAIAQTIVRKRTLLEIASTRTAAKSTCSVHIQAHAACAYAIRGVRIHVTRRLHTRYAASAYTIRG